MSNAIETQLNTPPRIPRRLYALPKAIHTTNSKKLSDLLANRRGTKSEKETPSADRNDSTRYTTKSLPSKH